MSAHPVLHPLSGEKGYPSEELPRSLWQHRGGFTHWGLCIPLTHTKPRAGSCFSSTCSFSSPSSHCPVLLQGSCHVQGPVCAHLSSPCQTAPSSREKLFFNSTMDFTTLPVLLPMDVPQLCLCFPCVAITASLCFVGIPDKENLEREDPSPGSAPSTFCAFPHCAGGNGKYFSP